MALIAGAGLCMLSMMSSSFGGLVYYLRDPEPATPVSDDVLLTETKTRIAKTLFQTTAEEVADAETTRL